MRKALLYLTQQHCTIAFMSVVRVYHKLADESCSVTLYRPYRANNSIRIIDHFQYYAAIEFLNDFIKSLFQRRNISAAEKVCFALIGKVLKL